MPSSACAQGPFTGTEELGQNGAAGLSQATAFSPLNSHPASLRRQMISGVRLCDSAAWSLPGSSHHEISQPRILEWVTISFSRGSSDPGIEPAFPVSPASVGGFFTTEPPGKPCSFGLLDVIFQRNLARLSKLSPGQGPGLGSWTKDKELMPS
ncbi:hypothetical protein R6Z07F_012304 [Ovis aries]